MMNILKKLMPVLLYANTFIVVCLCMPCSQQALLYGQTYHSGTITGVETWHAADNPHIVTGNIYIEDDIDDSFYGTTELIIEPGCLVKFNPGTGIAVGGFTYTYISEFDDWVPIPVSGTLSASGTINNPIIFTSNQTNPVPGDWRDINFIHQASYGIFHYCQLEYGTDGLYCNGGASPSIENSTISNFSNAGVYIYSGLPSITCTDIKNNTYGVYITYGSIQEIKNCNITGNTSYGIFSYAEHINAKNNWWGAVDGPSGCGTGSGDAIGSSQLYNQCFVDYTPFLTSPHTCSTTAVELVFFKAEAESKGNVTLLWETATEVDNAGFNIYRSRLRDGECRKINGALVPAQGNATSGASYNFEDTPPAKGTYYYKLEDVDTKGVSTMHGPEKVRVRK